MTAPLFESPYPLPSSLNISKTLETHIDQLKDKNVLDTSGELVAEVLLMLAGRLDAMSSDPGVKAYSISQISAQLLTWWEKLPALPEGSEDGLNLASALAALPDAS